MASTCAGYLAAGFATRQLANSFNVIANASSRQ
jgi:hypothetical protein